MPKYLDTLQLSLHKSMLFAEESLSEMEEGKPWYYARKGQLNLLKSFVKMVYAIDKEIPYIHSAAIKSPNGTIVSLPHPARHHDVIKFMNEHKIPHKTGEQGFILGSGRFVNREEAMKIAKEADQILDLDNIRPPNLYSEDLW